MALIPKPQFPNVPKLSGVPQLLRSPQFPPAPPPIVGVAAALGRLWQALFSQPSWAIYKHQEAQAVTQEGVETVTVVGERVPVVVPDSFLEFGYRNEYTVSDYPVQNGGFASYDKVANPFEIVLRLSKGGTQNARKEFLDSIDAIIGTLDLYDILTPEKTYLNVNVLRFEIVRRGNRGAYFFAEVDLYFREIRQVAATYSTTSTITENAQDPSALPVTNVGTVQGQTSADSPADVGIPEAEL